MPSNFPTSLDSFATVTSTTRTDTGVPHAGLHMTELAAIFALEAKIGIDGSLVTTTIDYRLAAVETVAAAAATAADITSEAATRAAADSTLSAAITTEATARAAGDASLTTALASKADLVAGVVPSAQLPSYVDDVLEYANFAAFPGTGETGKIYIDISTETQYRWSGSIYIELVASPGSTDVVAEGSTNLYFTAARVRAVVLTGLSLLTNAAITATDTILQALGKLQKQITDHLADTSNPHSVTKAQVGLGNCDNTSDANKPVSTAQATAIGLKVTANAPITGATKTKVTYDTNGLVTAGADATTADIADSTDKRYVTDAQRTVIGNTSGTNTGDQTNISGNAATATKLATARNINGQLFDGTADITIATGGGSASATSGVSNETYCWVEQRLAQARAAQFAHVPLYNV